MKSVLEVVGSERFTKLYGETVDITLFSSTPSSEEEYLAKYLPSKLWRLNNLYTIVDKRGIRIPFVMNYSQHRVYAASIEHARVIILKSRQQGISTFWLLSFLDDALFNSDFTIGLMAQGRSEAGTLLSRVKLGWETFPATLVSLLNLQVKTDNKDEKMWSNDSKLFIRTSFRSATLTRLHVSELGKIAAKNPERITELKTGTLQTIVPGNTLIIESTAEGNNEFKVMWENACIAKSLTKERGKYGGKDFLPIFLSWIDDPDCVTSDKEVVSSDAQKYFDKLKAEEDISLTKEQKAFWIQQYRELGDRIYQEYPATPEEAFLRVNDGSYYGVLFTNFVVKKNRLLAKLYDENLEVSVAIDLGMNDTFVMIYYQTWKGSLRIIDEYTNSGEPLSFYVDEMRRISKVKGYRINQVVCPHDIEVRDLGTGKTRRTILYDLGVNNIPPSTKIGIEVGIDLFRAQLKNTWIDVSCVYVVGCLRSYSKEWDETHSVWKSRPIHDKWSHGADTLRLIATHLPFERKEVEDLSPSRKQKVVNVSGFSI